MESLVISRDSRRSENGGLGHKSGGEVKGPGDDVTILPCS
jgi:hypothetical protein